MINRELKHVKIVFKLDVDADGYPPSEFEGVWATPLGEDRFRIDNVPFFVKAVANGDVVRAIKNSDGEFIFDEIVERGGHSTVRIFVTEEGDREAIRLAIKELGCDSEASHIKRLCSVDIPPSIPYKNIKKVLDAWEADGRIEYEEGCIY